MCGSKFFTLHSSLFTFFRTFDFVEEYSRSKEKIKKMFFYLFLCSLIRTFAV